MPILKFAFSMAVGYGDFNGSADTQTMVFTMFYAFIGIGILTIAIGEVLETLSELQQAAANEALEKMAVDMSAGTDALDAQVPGFLKQFSTWTQKNALTQVVRVMLPTLFVGIVGAIILVATEDDDSSIMTTQDPFCTAFYVSIITGITIGYGDFSPTSPAGRMIFSVWMVISVGLVVSSITQVAAMVTALRTSENTEIVELSDIMLMDVSGDGSIDESEYVMVSLLHSSRFLSHIQSDFKRLIDPDPVHALFYHGSVDFAGFCCCCFSTC